MAQEALFVELQLLMQRDNRTIIVSSHQVEVLERYADYITILHEGRILVSDRLDLVLNRYEQIDIFVGDQPLPTVEGLKLMNQVSRARYLVDNTILRASKIQQLPRAMTGA